MSLAGGLDEVGKFLRADTTISGVEQDQLPVAGPEC
jgi:hypothetical protein